MLSLFSLGDFQQGLEPLLLSPGSGQGTGVLRPERDPGASWVSIEVLQRWFLSRVPGPPAGWTRRQTPGLGFPEPLTPAVLSLPGFPAGLVAEKQSWSEVWQVRQPACHRHARQAPGQGFSPAWSKWQLLTWEALVLSFSVPEKTFFPF